MGTYDNLRARIKDVADGPLWFADRDLGNDEAITAIIPTTVAIQDLERARDDMIAQARREGHSWEKIAGALNMTRQSAWERFRHLDEPAK